MQCLLFAPFADQRVALLLVLTALVQPAFAVEKTWIGGNNNWFDGSMWSPSGVPAAADNVTIPAGRSTYPIVTANLNRSGNTAISANGSLDIEALFTNSGTITVSGIFSLNTGGSVNNNGAISILSGGYLINYEPFSNNFNGTFTIQSGAIVDLYATFDNGGTMTVNAGGQIAITPSVSLENTGTINNAGTILNYGYFNAVSGAVNQNGVYGGAGEYFSSAFVNPSTGSLGVTDYDNPECLIFGDGFINSGVVNFEFRDGGSVACTDFDKITVSGTATLGGTFTATFHGALPTPGTQFTVLTATTRTGSFSNSSFNLGGGNYANVSYTSNSVKIAFTNTPLPIELTRFSAHWQPAAKAVQLDWSTAQEHNNEGFEVERSTDGAHWQSLGFVAGKGTSAHPQDYLFQDAKPTPGLNYYRLRQLDTNGEVNLLNVVTVDLSRLSPLGQVQVFPNPASGDRFTVTLPASTGEEDVVGALYNTEGQLVRQMVLQSGANLLEVSTLSNGFYTLKITQNQQHHTVRIAVSKAD